MERKPIDIEGAADMYRKGATAAQVARQYDMSEMTVLKRLREHGVSIRKPGMGVEGSKKRSLSVEQRQEAARLYLEERLSTAALAGRFGCSKAGILAALRRAGVEPKRRRMVDEETLRSLADRYEAGERPEDLAQEVGYGRGGLMAAFRKIGVKMHRPGKIPMTANHPRAAEGLRLWDGGMGFKRAAKQAGIDEKTLRRILQETGRDPSERRSGPGHPLWKGGRQINDQGYVRAWMADGDPLVEMRGVRGYVLEHRLVMAQHLGRPLLPEETVHHKNGKRDDNRLANLELWSSRHAKGQRVEDLRQFAKEILELYPG